LKSITNTKALITIEEHSISGGIGEKCSSIILQNHLNILFRIIGIPDEYMINGSQSEVLDHYDMAPHKISNLAKALISK
jgi:transketolase